MYLTIKFVADGMMEPRILAVCNLSISFKYCVVVSPFHNFRLISFNTKIAYGENAWSVSYTHLDVYKRQALYRLRLNIGNITKKCYTFSFILHISFRLFERR